ncbi:MAG TPA: SagB/ThcOx family dehydrogenase [bacterium]|nr:SagB/ThcOx family dehydrogenase [bacterium]
MSKRLFLAGLALAALLTIVAAGAFHGHAANQRDQAMPHATSAVALPPPLELSLPLSRALVQRRSVRAYAKRPLSEQELATLLWSAQGVTHEGTRRTAPSAGALYPLEVFVATADGLFRYLPDGHRWQRENEDDLRAALADAAWGQSAVAAAPAVFVVTGVVARTAGKYGTRAERYVLLEMGHAAQNLHLAAVALGLVSVPVGAFNDEKALQTLGLDDEYLVGYLIPVGAR